MTSPTIQLDILPDTVALVRLPGGSAVPAWADQARQFLSITRTPGELSVAADATAVPAGVEAERDYRVLRVRGPLPLSMVGVMAALAVPLAEAKVPILPIATHDTDYILVRQSDLDGACDALLASGHAVTAIPPAS